MFCTHCGKEMPQGAEFCPFCGKSSRADGQQAGYGYQQPYQQPYRQATLDTGNTGWGVLGFFVPIVGLILYLIWQNDRPKDARMAGKGALISVIVSVSFSILAVVFVVVIAAIAASTYSVGMAALPFLSIL